jgi:hypothetical protein
MHITIRNVNIGLPPAAKKPNQGVEEAFANGGENEN